MDQENDLECPGEIAVIGMACRFPGSPNLSAFWKNLQAGAHGITFFTEEESARFMGEMSADPNFVGARGLLEDIDAFDAEAFGLNARDALLMDPQQRLLLETALHAMDHAGIDPAVEGHAMGVFAGVGSSLYGQRLWDDPAIRATAGALQLAIGNDKDYPAPRLSYLFNLCGPSLPVQTACSTSLVAVHMACQSLFSRECDTALAGGAAIPYLEKTGYLYQEDGIYSPDGFCRAFDARAGGTVPSCGAGLVVLKRLEDARTAGDRILAVISATAINNDGADKVGFTAPAVAGQRDVIEEALELAEADPARVGFVETHGTATNLGDPIEIEALSQAFGALPTGSCALGAVKTNIGHAGAAAGIAGLIKAVLCRNHDTLVPSLHFRTPNPKLGLENSPFYVNTERRPWPLEQPLAGVSSFGIGGTNAHVLLAPAPPPSTSHRPSSRHSQLLILSACGPLALSQHAANLAAALESPHAPELADAAFSLNGGRHCFASRSWVVAADRAEAAKALRELNEPAHTRAASFTTAVVFCFTGQGVSVSDWGAELYLEEPLFREAADRACGSLRPHLGFDLGRKMFGAGPNPAGPFYQPSLFVLGYALANTWIGLGVKPSALIGHSVGEYAAAVVAGVLPLEDAAAMIACRCAETERLPPGAMTALAIPEAEAVSWVGQDIALAAVNGARLCVFSGPPAAVEALETRARAAGIVPIRLPATRAFHSPMIEPALDALGRTAREARPNPPQIPLISGLTGTWMTAQQAADPDYWVDHMRRPVRFDQGLRTAASLDGALFLEVGPGQTLTALVSHMSETPPPALASLYPKISAARSFRQALGTLWAHGVTIDWRAWFGTESRRKVELPAYPFQRRSFWVSAGQETRALLETRRPPAEWYYRPVWKQVVPLGTVAEPFESGGVWLLFLEAGPLSQLLEERLTRLGQTILTVRPGPRFQHFEQGRFQLNPAQAEDYRALFRQLADLGHRPTRVIHGWSLVEADLSLENLTRGLDLGFSSLLRLAQAFSETKANRVSILAVTAGILTVGRGPTTKAAWRASLLGALRILPLEYQFLSCSCLDLGDTHVDEAARAILERCAENGDEDLWVSAHGLLWRQEFERAAEPARPEQMPRGGVYLIINAFQPLGYALNARLQSRAATAIMVDRTFLPEPTAWDDWLREQGQDDGASAVIGNLRKLEGRLFVQTADPKDPIAMTHVIDIVRREHGAIDGVFLLDRPTAANLAQNKPAADPAPILKEKMREAMVLGQTLSGLKFLALFTANRDEGGGIGQSEQAGGSAFLNSFSRTLPTTVAARTFVIEWGTLEQFQGRNESRSTLEKQLQDKRRRFGMKPEECMDVLERLLAADWPQAVISTRDYGAVLAQQKKFTTLYFKQQSTAMTPDARPELSTEYKAPRNDVERLLTELWQEAFAQQPLGIEDDFFELGGHSLLAVDLLAHMGRVFSVTVNLEDLFAHPTIAAMAAMLSGDELEVKEADMMEALLGRIEDLPPAEVEALLADLGDKSS